MSVLLVDGVRGYAHIERRGDVATLACSLVIESTVAAGSPVGFVSAGLRPGRLIHIAQGVPPDPPSHYCTIGDDGAILLSRDAHPGEMLSASWLVAVT